LRVLTFPLVSGHVLDHNIAGTGMTEGFVEYVDIIGEWLHTYDNRGWVCIFMWYEQSWAAWTRACYRPDPSKIIW